MTQPNIKNDYRAWLLHQVSLLESKQLDKLDVENLAIELEILSAEDAFRLDVETTELMRLSLLWDVLPALRDLDNKCMSEISELRESIEDILRKNPSLKKDFVESIDRQKKEAIAKIRIFYPTIVLDEDKWTAENLLTYELKRR